MLSQLQQIKTQVEAYGFAYRGHFVATAKDKAMLPQLGQPKDDASGQSSGQSSSQHRSIMLIGHIGSAFWPAFTSSPEYHDQQADPLDRYSMRIGRQIAQQFGAVALSPASKQPYPFYQWALRCGNVTASKMQLLIDYQEGLWHAYRFALVVPFALAEVALKRPQSVCQKCPHVACLHSCPVQAYTARGFHHLACQRYVTANPKSPCAQGFCQARVACPVGRENQYTKAHAQFHMHAFLS